MIMLFVYLMVKSIQGKLLYFENFVIDYTANSSLFFQEETTPCKVSVTLTQTSEAAPP
jgi:hypothetical protein